MCCRVSPQHKTRIVEALKARDHVVAMTGDGVNDAPALKRANIGVAMGITGTDVTKQTADMVLTDDNYASIVAAIEQGRIIYSNIRKFVYFLLACNAGEILIIFGAMLLGMPIPLRPVQLLWLNLVSDGAPALALGMEKGDRDIMKHPPRPPREPVINRDMAIGIGVIAIVDAVAILSAFSLGLQRYPGHLEAAQTIAFVTLCTSELIRAFTARSEYHSIFSIGVFSNRWMVGAVTVSFALVLMVVYVPFLSAVLRHRAAHAGRLALHAALLLRLADRDGARQALLPAEDRRREGLGVGRARAWWSGHRERRQARVAGNARLSPYQRVAGGAACRGICPSVTLAEPRPRHGDDGDRSPASSVHVRDTPGPPALLGGPGRAPPGCEGEGVGGGGRSRSGSWVARGKRRDPCPRGPARSRHR